MCSSGAGAGMRTAVSTSTKSRASKNARISRTIRARTFNISMSGIMPKSRARRCAVLEVFLADRQNPIVRLARRHGRYYTKTEVATTESS